MHVLVNDTDTLALVSHGVQLTVIQDGPHLTEEVIIVPPFVPALILWLRRQQLLVSSSFNAHAFIKEAFHAILLLHGLDLIDVPPSRGHQLHLLRTRRLIRLAGRALSAKALPVFQHPVPHGIRLHRRRLKKQLILLQLISLQHRLACIENQLAAILLQDHIIELLLLHGILFHVREHLGLIRPIHEPLLISGSLLGDLRIKIGLRHLVALTVHASALGVGEVFSLHKLRRFALGDVEPRIDIFRSTNFISRCTRLHLSEIGRPARLGQKLTLLRLISAAHFVANADQYLLLPLHIATRCRHLRRPR